MAHRSPYPNYEFWVQRTEERESHIFARIKNRSDPIDAIEIFARSEGKDLSAIWDGDAGPPLDGPWFCIVMIPLLLGVIGHYVGKLLWEPRLVGDELYDDYGNRIIEYPKMPIAYLQQSRKEGSAARENRNTLAWLCHKWIIATNDVVQELHAPYPLEENRSQGQKKLLKEWKAVAKLGRMFQDAAEMWRTKRKRKERENSSDSQDAPEKNRTEEIFRAKLVTAAGPELQYVKERVVKARRFWVRLFDWIKEYDVREVDERFLGGIRRSKDFSSRRLMSKGQGHYHPSDSMDSFWTSSETFSSDSGEHWKSYRDDARKWARKRKLVAQWRLFEIRQKMDIMAKENAMKAAAAAEVARLQAVKESQQQMEKAKIAEKFGEKTTSKQQQLKASNPLLGGKKKSGPKVKRY